MMNRREWKVALLLALGLVPALALLNRPTGAEAGLWSTHGPYQSGVRVNALAMRPDNAEVIWAATNKGLYKSVNAAERWVAKSSGLTGYGGLVVEDVAISHAQPNLMYAGTWGSGVYKSTDGGETWIASNNGLPGRSSSPPVSALVSEAAPAVPALGSSPDAAQRSAEGFALSASPGLAWTPVRRLAVNPYNDQYVYAAVWNHGVYRTTDGGQTWTDSLTDGAAYAVVIDPVSSNVLYASLADLGIYKSTNHGVDWVLVNADLTTAIGLAIDPQKTSTVYAADRGRGVFKSGNGGMAWDAMNEGFEGDLALRCLAVSRSAPNRVYAGSDLWLYRSDNGGENWTLTAPTFPSYFIDDILVHPTLPDVVYLASDPTGGGGVFKSTDGGSQLAVKTSGLLNTIVYAIRGDPSNPRTVYAGTWGGGVFKSVDGGLTWAASNGTGDDILWLSYVYDLGISPAMPKVLYAGTAYDDEGVFKSSDGGASWVEMSNGLPGDDRDIFAVAVDPGNYGRLYVGTENNVFRSENGAGDWQATTGIPDDTQVLALGIDPRAYSVVYAGTYGKGVYKSGDYGASWQPVNSGLGSLYVYHVLPDPQVANRVYAATANRVYRSDNGGGSWTLSAAGLPMVAIRALDALPSTGMFAGTHNQGVYRAGADGRSWSTLNSGLGSLQIRAIGAVSGDEPTIYAGTEGLGIWNYALKQGTRVYLPIVLQQYQPGSMPTPLFSDDFSNPGSGWSVSDDGNRRYAYVSGEYQVLIKTINWYSGLSSGFRCVDCAVELQGRIAGSEPGWLGILFGITDNWSEYLFRINDSQQYSLRMKGDAGWGDYLVDWTGSPHINPTQSWNRLRVERNGSSIALYANGGYLTTVYDGTYTGNLRVGLTASSRETVPVDFRFDNFAVYPLGSGAPERDLASSAPVHDGLAESKVP